MSLRSIAPVGAALAALVLAGCGGAAPRTAAEPSREFTVNVTGASFPTSQRLAEQTHLVLAIRNAGTGTIPDIAVTVCNVTCAHSAPPGQGTSAAAFGQNLQMAGVANPSRPVWVVDRPPGPCHAGCGTGGPGGAATAYSNTWALGPLPPGRAATFDWALTAVKPGRHVVAWEVAAGLDGKARAVMPDGSKPHGTFTVLVHSAPAQTHVSDNGQVVTTG